MGLGSMFFGDPERKRREKQEREERQQQESKRQKEINKAYIDAKIEQRKKNAVAAGIADANKLANQKPFYQKVMGVGMALGKDVMAGASKTNPGVLFNFDEPKQPRKRRKKRRR
jgi:hypothetical protein